jgi:V/A-type H+/Na+-transporting ATPase subunit D
MTTRSTTSRAARLQLMSRLDLARHASELLHGKEQALQRERVRLQGHAGRAERQWVESCELAASWLQRARCLGASDELAEIAGRGPRPAMVTIEWQTSMGITYPDSVECRPARQPGLSSTAALQPAMDAHHRALEHAATHAATTAALARLDSELATTRRRRRAIADRLVPALEADLQDLELHLDEQDREEALRVHLATEQREQDRRERKRS